MALTGTQQELAELAVAKLRKRRMVFFQGKPNGKTKIIDNLLWKTCREAVKDHDENVDLIHVTHFKTMPRGDKITITSIERLILEFFECDFSGNIMRVEKNYSDLMLQMRKDNQVPLLAFDNIEIMPRRFFYVMKILNEYSFEGKKLGCAVVLGGDVLHSKMTQGIYEKCSEITVERIERISEIRDVLTLAFPENIKQFSTPALEQLKRCQTVQQMMKSAEMMIDAWANLSTKKGEAIPEDLAMKMVSKAGRIYSLAA